MTHVIELLSLLGNIAIFGLRAIASAFVPPYEWPYFLMQVESIGWQSVPLISAAGIALGVVMTMHTRKKYQKYPGELRRGPRGLPRCNPRPSSMNWARSGHGDVTQIHHAQHLPSCLHYFTRLNNPELHPAAT